MLVDWDIIRRIIEAVLAINAVLAFWTVFTLIIKSNSYYITLILVFDSKDLGELLSLLVCYFLFAG